MEIIEEVIKYIVSHNIPNLGRTKLAKLLFFIDREVWILTSKKHFLGRDFLRKQFGPLVENFATTLETMQNNHEIKIENQSEQIGEDDWLKYDAISLDKPYNTEDIEQYITKQERLLIDYVIKKFGKKPAQALVDMTHDDTWKALSDGAIMPYEAYPLQHSTKKVKLTKQQRKRFNATIKEYEQQKSDGILITEKIDINAIRCRMDSKS